MYNEGVISSFYGYLVLIIYGLVLISLTLSYTKSYRNTKLEFLLANRKLGLFESSFSIAANWIWAPALFISSEIAYTKGVIGLFWFVFPNVLTLVLFAFFAKKLRKKYPDGFTLSEYMRTRYSKRVQYLYLFQLIALSICSFSVQLLAGGLILSMLTGIDFFYITIILTVIPIIYSTFSGLKASVFSDFIMMIIILLVIITIIPSVVFTGGGIEKVLLGLGGINHQYNDFFSGSSLSVFLNFGLITTIGLLSGPFGDQTFYQRAFACDINNVKKSFIYAAFIFSIVPLSLSLLGFIAAGNGLIIKNTQLVNLETVLHFLPLWTAIPFTLMLISGLMSTLDSHLSAISSMAGNDILGKNDNPKKFYLYTRISMLILGVSGILISNIPGIKILYLFLFYGTLRASTFLPTIITILKEKVSEKGVFYGIIVSLIIGLPIFSYGNFYNVLEYKVIGVLFTVLFSGFFTLLKTKYEFPEK